MLEVTAHEKKRNTAFLHPQDHLMSLPYVMLISFCHVTCFIPDEKNTNK